jgi:hypothetical protein
MALLDDGGVLHVSSGEWAVKGELVPTMLYAEGRSRDVGTDRALANAINVFHDRKSAHQSPWLTRDVHTGGGSSTALLVRPVFFGTEHLSSTVVRSVTVAPWFRSSAGGNVSITVTLSEMLPVYAPAQDYASAVFKPSFPGRFAQATWTTTSTTWTTGADATLSLGVKDLEIGFAFLVIETTALTGSLAECRGLAKCIEGVRVVV